MHQVDQGIQYQAVAAGEDTEVACESLAAGYMAYQASSVGWQLAIDWQ